MRLLLLSNSTNFGETYLHHAKGIIADFLADCREVLFIPFAGVTISYDEYEAKVKEALTPLGIHVHSIHHEIDPVQAVKNAKSIMVGGGNTFRLLELLQSKQLIEPIKNCVNKEVPFIGWSAGSNIAGPTIKTTNDMPVSQPLSFEALHLVNFQLNPHFTMETLAGHNGETRLQRLQEFGQLNPNTPVIGLPESTWLQIEGKVCTFHGNADYLWLKGNSFEFRRASNIPF